jgi:hypothetical protein
VDYNFENEEDILAVAINMSKKLGIVLNSEEEDWIVEEIQKLDFKNLANTEVETEIAKKIADIILGIFGDHIEYSSPSANISTITTKFISKNFAINYNEAKKYDVYFLNKNKQSTLKSLLQNSYERVGNGFKINDITEELGGFILENSQKK